MYNLLTGYCSNDDVTDHMMATAQAILRGYQETTGHAMDGFEGMFDFDTSSDVIDDYHSNADAESSREDL